MNPLVQALVRLVVPIYGLINLILISYGYNPMPFSEEDVTIAVSGIITAAGTFYVWWKNANVTKEAQQAQEYLDQLKEKK